MENDDWKTRLKAYEDILQLMSDPSPELLDQLSAELPNYLADENSNCQRTALLICEKYLKFSPPTAIIVKISNTILQKGLLTNPQTSDVSKNFMIQCLQKERQTIVEQLFTDIESKSDEFIKIVFSIIVSHLATLTSKDSEYISYIIDSIKPLQNCDDPQIRNEVSSVIASAKLVSGSDLDTASTPKTLSPRPKTDFKPRWVDLLNNPNWKDRKSGYEELLSSINENSQLQFIEHNFLVPATTEKNVQCETVAIQIIEKLAIVFKNQLMRKLREYITPIINALSQKRQSRQKILQSAFDSVALNVVASPYEPPFVEHLLKMMNSTSIRLKEESILFINRCQVTPISQPIIDALNTLTSDPNSSIRELASNTLSKFNLKAEATVNNSNEPPQDDRPKVTARARSPDINRRNIRRHTTILNTKTLFENWIDPNTYQLLISGQWASVTKGLDSLKKQFEQNPIQNYVIIIWLCSYFTGKLFTPKVMTKLMQLLIYFIKYDKESINNETITYATQFSLDNITEKKFELLIFEILDLLTEINSPQNVFQILYTQITAKNPALPLHISLYFQHYLTKYKKLDTSLNVNELISQIKILSGHNDSVIRKISNDCLDILNNNNENSNNNKTKAIRKNSPSKITIQQTTESKTSRIRSEIPIARNRPMTPQKPFINNNIMNDSKSLIPNRLIIPLTKTTSNFEVRKALDEIEVILNKQLEKIGPSTVSSTEFTELFQKLRQWFKDSNASIVLSITHLIGLCFKLIKKEEILNISNDFLVDTSPSPPQQNQVLTPLQPKSTKSKSKMNPIIDQIIESPQIQMYKWISDLLNNDIHLLLQPLKLISNQLKNDINVFKPHIDTLLVALIRTLHIQLSLTPLPTRVCKYAAFCMLTILGESEAHNKMRNEYVEQVIFDIVTCNSMSQTQPNEQVLVQVLNAIVIKLIDDFRVISFNVIVRIFCDCDNVNDGIYKNVLRYFENCIEMTSKNSDFDEVIEVVNVIDELIVKNSMQMEMKNKVLKIVSKFLGEIGNKFKNEFGKKDVNEKLDGKTLEMLNGKN
ncbi:hypothetical protein GPJ56_010001 [Histomonas meleagridis]|uniref:uncharacterized protein n=1 Tax=Histomonas meleagridis TaxID=135588 RepID=UPI00355A34B2|nr:hypothetical protein GPJ56_010001 [Histomonas meleagridis]KAH0803046.1 hypothetical protein GO595_004139 [Histomonas meleagridis]